MWLDLSPAFIPVVVVLPEVVVLPVVVCVGYTSVLEKVSQLEGMVVVVVVVMP